MKSAQDWNKSRIKKSALYYQLGVPPTDSIFIQKKLHLFHFCSKIEMTNNNDWSEINAT